MEEIEIPTASKVEPRPRIITPASKVFDPLGRHHLGYARPPREKTFAELTQTWWNWSRDHLCSVRGRRIVLVCGVALMLYGGTSAHPILSAAIILTGMLMVESVIIIWARES